MNVTTALPNRTEIPETFTWDLTPIYRDDSQWEADRAALAARVADLAAYQGRLGESAATVLEALTLRDALGRQLERLWVYAARHLDEDTTDARYQAQVDRLRRLAAELATVASFFRPELLALPDGTLERFMGDAQGLHVYAHQLDDLRRDRPHVLPAAQEALLAQAADVMNAPRIIYNMLSDADLTLGTVRDETGADVPLTRGRYELFMRSLDRRVRRDAFETLFGAYKAHRNTCAAALAGHVRKNVFGARVRGHPSALAAALHADNLPVEVYTNLIETVHDHLPHLQRYLELRRRVLGVDQLHMYDIHVPLVESPAEEVPYEEAVETVLAACAPLGEAYVAAARAGIRARWVDVFETPNKRSGAHCGGGYDTPPYIMLNHQPTLRGMYVIAHELGHAMHSYFTNRTQPYIYSGYTMFLAEIASTLNEALLTHFLVERTADPATRAALLNQELDNIRATLYRQVMLAEFEMLVHAAVESGEALTADAVSETYLGLNRRYYGPDVVSDDTIAIEWAYIPHFYLDFYVFQYATGLAAATALARRILTEGPPAAERTLRLLAAGDSDYSIDLLREAGVDMRTPGPVAEALGGVFADRLRALERLVATP